MSESSKLFLIVIVSMLLATLFIGCEFISTNNECVRQESALEAQYKQNKNNYNSYFMKLHEASQVPAMYLEDLKKLYDSAMKGRYGADGTAATLQFIIEHNPTLDQKSYLHIQQMIESGRDAFEEQQKLLLDKKRVYENYLNEFPTNAWAKALGFPKKNLNEFDIVVGTETENVFETKHDQAIKLR